WAAGSVNVTGGLLGGGLTQWLAANFPTAGRFLVFFAALAVGLFLAADVVLLWAARRLGRVLRAVGRIPLPAWSVRGTAAHPDETEDMPAPAKIERPIKFPRSIDPKPVPISRPTANLKAEGPAILTSFKLPPVNLLEDPDPFPQQEHDNHLREQAALLEKT